jgi:V-type H+-transporting ATPase subunit E
MAAVRSLNDEEVQNEMKKMIEFIRQEAFEKAREIQVKADEEFNIEKGKLVRQEALNVEAIFDRKIKQAEVQRRIATSNHINKSRLKVLQAREEMLEQLYAESREQLQQISQDNSKYAELLRDLVLQGFYSLMEPEVVVVCRAADKDKVTKAIDDAAQIYKSEVGSDVKATVDTNNPLPASCSGGVVLQAQGGRIKVDNTLEARLAILEEKMLPQIRVLLFGHSANRRFFN